MTIASEITRLQNDKAAMCAAIENKWVTVGNVTFDDYASCIDAIQAWGGWVWYIDFLMVWWGGWGAWAYWGAGWWWGWWWFVEECHQAIYNQQYPVKIWKWWIGTACCTDYYLRLNQDTRGGDTVFYWVAYWWGWWWLSMSQNGASWWWWRCNGGAGMAIHWTQWCNGNAWCTSWYWWWWGGASTVCSGSCAFRWWCGKSSSMSGTQQRYSWWWWGGTRRGSNCAFAWWCGGGGKWGSCTTDGENATCYGWGWGWGWSNHKWGNGCQWVVIIRYKTDGSCGVCCATWGTITTSWDYTIHTFTTDGIFTPIL